MTVTNNATEISLGNIVKYYFNEYINDLTHYKPFLNKINIISINIPYPKFSYNTFYITLNLNGEIEDIKYFTKSIYDTKDILESIIKNKSLGKSLLIKSSTFKNSYEYSLNLLENFGLIIDNVNNNCLLKVNLLNNSDFICDTKWIINL